MSNQDDNTVQDLIELEKVPFDSNQAIRMLDNPRVLALYQSRLKDSFYQAFFLALTHERFSHIDAKLLWDNVPEHRRTLESHLQRDPGYMVALLDYVTNILRHDIDPILIDSERSSDILDESTRDQLTELFRRNVFDEMLQQEFEECQRTRKCFSLIMIDIDDFKLVNDNWGHQLGDEVLITLGKLLNKSVRAMDIAARYGGEELVILMPDTELKIAVNIAERIRHQIEHLNFSDFNVTASFGVADSNFNSSEQVVEAADKALYRAKDSGKNCVKFVKSGME